MALEIDGVAQVAAVYDPTRRELFTAERGGGAFLNVHREGLAVDQEETCGVYVGANTGQLWMSRDEGNTWQEAPIMLPGISSVTAFSL